MDTPGLVCRESRYHRRPPAASAGDFSTFGLDSGPRRITQGAGLAGATMSGEWVIGIIGGSGLYAIDALEDAQWIGVKSPFGAPSDEILCGRIGEVQLRFLPRHGRGASALSRRRECARQYRCAEARGLHRYFGDLGGGIARRKAGAGAVRGGRPVYRPHQGAGEQLLRQRLRGACRVRRPGLPAALCDGRPRR